jgi:hypothetical protein
MCPVGLRNQNAGRNRNVKIAVSPYHGSGGWSLVAYRGGPGSLLGQRGKVRMPILVRR